MAHDLRFTRLAVALGVGVVLLAACDGGGDDPADGAGEVADGDGAGSPDDDAGTADGGPGVDGPEAADGSSLPEVALLDPAEVVDPDDPDTLDAAVASAATGLPDGWEVAVVPDADLGPFVVGLPEDATIWRVGEDVAPLADAVQDGAWLRYWEPVLADASDAADTSSLRSVIALPAAAADGVELHLTVSATPRQDLPVDDPEAVAEAFADSFREQQLEVEAATTASAGDDEVAAVTMTTPADEFDDGVPRRLQQWFYAERGSPVLWSLTCEAPVPAAGAAEATCPTVLGSFRTPPR